MQLFRYEESSVIRHLCTQILGNVFHIIQSIGIDDFSAHWTLICCIQNSTKIKWMKSKSGRTKGNGNAHFVICGLKHRKSQAGQAAKFSLETC